MKKVSRIVIVSCLSFTVCAGDTNFVAAFQTVWQTHNASNILVFAEQNVATNASPETFFARGIVAVMLQSWHGATNHFEQSVQMIATNNAYAEIGRTNVIKDIRGFQNAVLNITDNPQPAWDTNRHAIFFAELSAEPIFFDTLKNISTIEPSGN